MGESGTWAFREMSAVPSPQLRVKLSLHVPSYTSISLPLPDSNELSRREMKRAFQERDEKGVADTGAQMAITSEAIVRAMGIDT